ncbi:NAD(+) synthase [Granulosicoccus antarcticus]|uniref:NH(3)-dependent NAD(+) synthetase n=1 Tax=Granulosicoccus antarcticus IMCC3135 TaxID=1192854 RepID=A0A2Z2NXU1_9GAMM|nr:NAD(+) synthase [Granulosicoccus antarcticus]ASJ74801.1 NH(3)-dependent NAD(+) synthetase [Granulosicoccus antarcticus IMCC3135]
MKNPSASGPETGMGEKVLELDYEKEATRIAQWIPDVLTSRLRKRGVVVAISGGIDSSVCAGLAVKALGPKRVFGLLLPERDSSDSSSNTGRELAEHLGIAYETHDIAPALESLGCYRQRDEAIRRVVPEYTDNWKSKIVIAGGIDGGINFFRLVAEDPEGGRQEHRLALPEYLQIVAATNYKQRIRKSVEYFHADRLNYAVVGTPNRLEYDQGFFVRNGDGSADLKPIAHLYKTQVYAMAHHLALPDSILAAVPTTDTYSLPQGQDEFYFSLPYQQMDLALWALNHQRSAAELALLIGSTEAQAQRVYDDILNKRRATRSLHAAAELIEPVLESLDVANKGSNCAT